MAGQVQNFTWPNSVTLREIENDKLSRSLGASPIFRYFPQTGIDSHLLQWTQRDTYGGMTQLRGMNGQPPRVVGVGERDYIFTPGVYGEHRALDENEMTTRARYARPTEPIPIDDLVIRMQDHLLGRRLNRIEWLCWQLFLNGQFIAHGVNNSILHRAAYAVRTYDSAVAWSDTANARPMYDLQQVQLAARGTTGNWGPRARALMNSVTASWVTNNTNAADIGGKRINQNTISSINEANLILTGGSLPTIEVYDGGYRDASGTWTPHIPDGKVGVAAELEIGETIGEFLFTRNINVAGGVASAPYVKVIRKDQQVPFEVEAHDGFNGGPVVYYPGAINVMDVS